jgi:biopolymer transport protein ExbD
MRVGVKEIGRSTSVQYLLRRTQRKAQTKKVMIAGLMLTSMIDMFSLLVIFLLQNFSASTQQLYVNKNMVLPNSASSNEIADAPVLAISENDVVLDSKVIGSLEILKKEPSALMEALKAHRESWMVAHPNEEFDGKIIIQADKKVSSAIVAHFMGMLPTQKYSSIQLAVISGVMEMPKEYQ